MNIIIEFLAEVVDVVGSILSVPASIVLDLGSYLHMMAVMVQNRNNDINEEQ